MAEKEQTVDVTIKPPKFLTLEVLLKNTSPYVQNRISDRSKRDRWLDQQTPKKERSKERQKRWTPHDEEEDFEQSKYLSEEGWHGIPCVALFKSMYEAIALIPGITKKVGKLQFKILPDGFDHRDGTPLIRIIKGDPKPFRSWVIIMGAGCLTVRTMYLTWEARVHIEFDQDSLKKDDVINLLMRAGRQVGIGEGRASSPKGVGQGWGYFEIVNPPDKE